MLSVDASRLVMRWCDVAQNRLLYWVENLDELKGRPWDNPCYLRCATWQNNQLILDVSGINGFRFDVQVIEIDNVIMQDHHWGKCLVLDGDVCVTVHRPSSKLKWIGVLNNWLSRFTGWKPSDTYQQNRLILLTDRDWTTVDSLK
jgi:hypothetical protein